MRGSRHWDTAQRGSALLHKSLHKESWHGTLQGTPVQASLQGILSPSALLSSFIPVQAIAVSDKNTASCNIPCQIVPFTPDPCQHFAPLNHLSTTVSCHPLPCKPSLQISLPVTFPPPSISFPFPAIKLCPSNFHPGSCPIFVLLQLLYILIYSTSRTKRHTSSRFPACIPGPFFFLFRYTPQITILNSHLY